MVLVIGLPGLEYYVRTQHGSLCVRCRQDKKFQITWCMLLNEEGMVIVTCTCPSAQTFIQTEYNASINCGCGVVLIQRRTFRINTALKSVYC